MDIATRVVRAGGYEEMSIRSLAAELGVGPMSLYRHVRDKDDLLGEVVDRLLAEAWRPSGSPTDRRSWIGEAAERLRHLLVAQPAALHVYLQHPVATPAAIERMNAMMAVLRDMTGDEGLARRAYGAIHTYTIGFAALEASRSRRGAARGRGGESGVAAELAAYTTPSQFADGLRYLLDGVQRDSARRGSDGSEDREHG